MQAQKNSGKLITKDMLVTEIVEKHEEAIPILMGYGLHCIGCSFSSFDTIESGAKLHGMDGKTIKMMMKDLNAAISESGK